MTCFHPIKAYRAQGGAITFNPHQNLIEGSSLTLPCGRCSGCRVDRAKAWAIRCHHESKSHDANCFLTLTYDDQHVPVDYSVKLRDLQLFNKRLRKSLPQKIRFFACGEYGGQFLRPHYHSLIFNYKPSDLKLFAISKTQNKIYSSQSLQLIWPYGQVYVGDVTYKSAGYVARYSLKKINGDRADDNYTRVSPIDGNTYRVASEFLVMSRRPGIGSAWLQKYASDCFPSDFLIIDGRKVRPPAFYLKQMNERLQLTLKRKRAWYNVSKKSDNTPARLAVREQVHNAKINRLTRS